VDAAVDAAGVREDEVWWSLIRLTFRSPARVAMAQAQDILGLGSEARMNTPGEIGKAWKWKLKPRALTHALAQRLRAATEEAGRLT
jgi:4-alpha-glucanotransferase